MTTTVLPGVPDVAGKYVSKDPQLRELLLAMKVTLQLLKDTTVADLNTLLENLSTRFRFNDDESTDIGYDGLKSYTKIEHDGTVVFAGEATVWNDVNIGGVSLGGPPAFIPDQVKFLDNTGADTGIYTLGFAVGEIVGGGIEIPHSYKEGSDLYLHVHWQGNDAPTGTDKVKWEATYTVARHGETLAPATTIVVETDFDTQYGWRTSTFPVITGTNFKMGEQFMFSLSRIAASADEYGGDALIFTVGLHYEQDTVGSRQIITK